MTPGHAYALGLGIGFTFTLLAVIGVVLKEDEPEIGAIAFLPGVLGLAAAGLAAIGLS